MFFKNTCKEIVKILKSPKERAKLIVEVIIFGLILFLITNPFSFLFQNIFSEKTDINVECKGATAAEKEFIIKNNAPYGSEDFNLVIKNIWTYKKTFDESGELVESIWPDKEKRDWYSGLKLDTWAMNNCRFNDTIFKEFYNKACYPSREDCLTYTDSIGKRDIPIIHLTCDYIPPNTESVISFLGTGLSSEKIFEISYWGKSTPFVEDKKVYCKRLPCRGFFKDRTSNIYLYFKLGNLFKKQKTVTEVEGGCKDGSFGLMGDSIFYDPIDGLYLFWFIIFIIIIIIGILKSRTIKFK